MAVMLTKEEGDLRVLHVSGMLRKAEFDAAIMAETQQWDQQTQARVLVIVKDFQGWEQTEEWGDLSFFSKYSDRIDKIAIVADPQWETELLVFAGAGFRRAPVKFFPSQQINSARAWIK